ncbi:MAG: hypothetical protein RSA52_06810, partial [Acetivibrio sp.]
EVKQEEPQNTQEPESKSKTGVNAYEDEKGNRFLQEELRLQIIEPDKNVKIPSDYIKTTIVMDGLPIPVYEWKQDLSSDKLLVYGKNQEDKKGLYVYSRENHSLEEYNEKNLFTENMAKESKIDRDEYKNYTEKIIQMGITLGIMGIICVLLTIALVFQGIKNKNKKNEKEEDFF